MSMFGNAKPTASLSSGLLARKGQAKPAMRPQALTHPATLDDLGWNDLGSPAPIDPIDPAARPELNAPLPPVLREREALAQEVAAGPAPVSRPVSANTVARMARETAAKKTKAAFTLRLDADRHLRLRLASAVRNQSAQALLIQALDAFLTTVPEAEALASQLPRAKGRK
ncbi:hypothetical protein [Sphingomonas qomolangmaensis]|uniref:CopG family transcriptional regulator n=1 Tax=Sphingomonas qomolangmaensis TaxID=2918765 RepID=A0ABY5L9W5_9SPHN|nr:hypothetical protein [Sphingomonas qomolangmaensis]UUL83750.1 hypothetical protein NMP03_06010 [Sphingomonas qomolangmaensis]